MMNDHGIAWMIAGGVRAQSPEDRRQRLHRLAIADSRSGNDDTLFSLRRRFGARRLAAFLKDRAVARADSTGFNADCCPA